MWTKCHVLIPAFSPGSRETLCEYNILVTIILLQFAIVQSVGMVMVHVSSSCLSKAATF